jgi:hypothetical protein
MSTRNHHRTRRATAAVIISALVASASVKAEQIDFASSDDLKKFDQVLSRRPGVDTRAPAMRLAPAQMARANADTRGAVVSNEAKKFKDQIERRSGSGKGRHGNLDSAPTAVTRDSGGGSSSAPALSDSRSKEKKNRDKNKGKGNGKHK